MGAPRPTSGTLVGQLRMRVPRRRRTVGGMGVLGELFPGPKVLDEASEVGDGQKWRLGPIDLGRC